MKQLQNLRYIVKLGDDVFYYNSLGGADRWSWEPMCERVAEYRRYTSESSIPNVAADINWRLSLAGRQCDVDRIHTVTVDPRRFQQWHNCVQRDHAEC